MSFDLDPCFSVTPAPVANWMTIPHRLVATTALVSYGTSSPQRATLEEFVRREFLVHFGARIRNFMPELLGLHGPDGAIRAVVGCRAAASERLFLETYPREPIEIALASLTGLVVPRQQIVEIGSLACRNAAAAVAIVRALVPHLLRAGFSWVVFTGADTVMNVFRHLGLAPRTLCHADPLLLGETRHDWGTYYDHEPHVMVGRIADGIAATRTRAARRTQ